MKTDVAIVGASGYGSRELIRILLGHPGANVAVATSRQGESATVADFHPSLLGRIDLSCEPFDADRIADRCGVAFLGLPHTASMEAAPLLRERGVRVIDLSADYRLKDAGTYADWYGHAHTDPAGLLGAVYGLPELYRGAIPTADLIANPGCYTSTAILALAPLVAADRIERSGIIVDAYSGISGAGRSPKPHLHFPEANENLVAYSVGRHRHTPEIDQVLTDVGSLASPDPVEVIFTPHLAPVDRGIQATIHAAPKGPAVEHDLMDLFRAFYIDSPFVRIVRNPPGTKDSVGSNFIDITIRVVRGRIVILAALDNLIKGASGVAVQNFNLMFDHPETLGLL